MCPPLPTRSVLLSRAIALKTPAGWYGPEGTARNSLRDRQASVFAAELLMPREAFCRVCRTCGNDVTRVAFHFGVSPAAAGVRMAIPGLE